MKQVGSILDDLNIKYNTRCEYTYTKDSSVKILLDFTNKLENLLVICDTLDLTYAVEKQEKLDNLNRYLLFDSPHS